MSLSGSLDSQITADFMSLSSTIARGIGRRAALPVPWVHHLPTTANRRYNRACAVMRQVAAQFISSHITVRNAYDDILQALLTAHGEEAGEPCPATGYTTGRSRWSALLPRRQRRR